MKTSTLTIKGQVTVPKELRDKFGWKSGERVAFVMESDGVKLVRATRRGRGAKVVEQLKRATSAWNRKISTDRLMTLTRGHGR